MSAAAKSIPAPRYGSAAQLATYSGLSVKTVRRMVDAGKVRGLKVGSRLLIPFEDLDRHILRMDDHRTPKEDPIMAIAETDTGQAAPPGAPYVPPIAADDLARGNRELAELLDSWESDGDEQEQRETLAVLREALGSRRVASDRALFP